ncbi:phosphatase PAP2 family protein [Histidinibacterium aquaticum]|uniref:Phosphatase PAP2 family protein n=1 Tax=Histidinibacterium aquaticum TaxID=2613962 RepID=A0A5J5GP76_9RHOB|nr:phosphatase PAP2 family protein [Histidinibacterium aquaticum]KAA9010186.1 phosphatase PAP2 family protein [Histidinibacterium aquaticum]
MDLSRAKRGASWVRRNVEISSMLVLALSVAAVWAFAELADAVLEGATRDLDRDLLLLLRTPGDLSDPIGPPLLEEIGRDLTALGGVIVLTMTTLAVAGFFLLQGKIRSTIFLFCAVGGGILISGIAKEAFSRPRPDLVPHGSIVHTASFPSGHSMMAAVTYLALGVLVARVVPLRRLKVYVLSVATTITILVGVSRVYLGVHWPTDVLAGWLAGVGWAVICLIAARLLALRGHVEPHADEDDSDPRSARETRARAGGD